MAILSSASELNSNQLMLFMSMKKNPSTCATIELLGTIFGFSGIGHAIGGNVGLGVAMLVGYWIYLSIILIIGTFTCGFGLLLIFPWWIASPLMAQSNAKAFNNRLLRELLARED